MIRFPLFMLSLFAASIVGCAHVEDLPEVPDRVVGKEAEHPRKPQMADEAGPRATEVQGKYKDEILEFTSYLVLFDDGREVRVETQFVRRLLLDQAYLVASSSGRANVPTVMIVKHRVGKAKEWSEHLYSEASKCGLCPTD